MEVKRNSNFELMRIVSMFLIVISHVIGHGKIIDNSFYAPGIKEIFTFLNIITLVHVNSFILVTGYYQSTSTFKQKKIWKLITEIIFYDIGILLLLMLFKVIPFDKNLIIKYILPIELIMNSYWFIKYYIILYFLSPYINTAINSFSKKQFRNLLLILTIISSILPFLCGLKAIGNNGYSLYQFIYMYLIGSYLRKYQLEDNYIGKRLSPNLMKLILTVILILSILANYLLQKAGNSLHGINFTLDIISDNIKTTTMLYNNPFVVVQSICYFYLFKMSSFNNKIINKLSNLTIGIYLIHDNQHLRPHLYKWLKIDNGYIYSYKFIIYAFLIAILIFLVSALIELIRQLIFNLISKLKISKKIRKKYYDWFNSLYIINN